MFDLVSKATIATFGKPVANFGVSGMALSKRASTLAITQGKVLYLKDLESLKNNVEAEKFVTIKRDAKLTCVAVSGDGLSVAAGDEFGKIYHITNPKGSITLII